MRLVLLLTAAVYLSACSGQDTTDNAAVFEAKALGVAVSEQWIVSRDTKIPITLTLPKPAQSAPPLVVMLHGHGGTGDEAGGFTQLAEKLANAGVASVRMDFPGCGDSTEPFRNNRLSTMLADARATRDHVLDNYEIDATRLALMGFSMGGRLAITLAHEDPRFHTLALWAPAGAPGTSGLVKFLGGAEALAAAKSRAKAEGFTPFTTSWGQKQELSAGWFDDMEKSRPQELIAKYKGAVFVLYGDKDTVVLPTTAEAVVSAASQSYFARSFVIVDADHGLGLFSNEPELTRVAVTQTVEAIVAGLQEGYVP